MMEINFDDAQNFQQVVCPHTRPGPAQDSLRPKAEILKEPFTSKYHLNKF